MAAAAAIKRLEEILPAYKETWRTFGDLDRLFVQIEHSIEVDVDRLLPILDTQLIEERNWRNACIVDENIELAVPLTC